MSFARIFFVNSRNIDTVTGPSSTTFSGDVEREIEPRMLSSSMAPFNIGVPDRVGEAGPEIYDSSSLRLATVLAPGDADPPAKRRRFLDTESSSLLARRRRRIVSAWTKLARDRWTASSKMCLDC